MRKTNILLTIEKNKLQLEKLGEKCLSMALAPCSPKARDSLLRLHEMIGRNHGSLSRAAKNLDRVIDDLADVVEESVALGDLLERELAYLSPTSFDSEPWPRGFPPKTEQ